MNKSFILLATLLINANAFAQATSCPEHYAGGDAPEFINQKLAERTRGLCYQGYVAMDSGITKTPLWSAEHLTQERLRQASQVKRINRFHPEPSLPHEDRAELADYVGSNFDRGHMAPSADMPTAEAQQESFSLGNMVPQNPNNNRNLWEGIESAVRKLAKQRGELYVITGPVFQGSTLKRLNGRVLVPTHLFKVIYDPAHQEAAAYLVPNQPGWKYSVLSVAELENMTGLKLFPRMPDNVKRSTMSLPEPTPHGKQGMAAHAATR
jgi:endonuclease G